MILSIATLTPEEVSDIEWLFEAGLPTKKTAKAPRAAKVRRARKVRHRRLHQLVDWDQKPNGYWIEEDSPDFQKATATAMGWDIIEPTPSPSRLFNGMSAGEAYDAYGEDSVPS